MSSEEKHYSRKQLLVGGLAALLVGLIFLETVCLSVLFVVFQHKGWNTSYFFHDHFLTRPFSKQVVPGKRFIGNLEGATANWREILQPDSLLGWRMAPDVAGIHIRRYLYVTDRNGFIADPEDAPITTEKRHGVFRIIVIGGSTVMGQGASRPSENLVGYLRKIASESVLGVGRESKAIEIINAGVGGYQSGQEYLYLYSELLRFSPDLVVVYDGWNDSIYNNMLVAKYPTAASNLTTTTHLEMSSRIQRSFEISGAAYQFATALGNWIGDLQRKVALIELPMRTLRYVLTKGATVPLTISDPVIYDKRSVLLYEQNLRAILSLAKLKGFAVALFLQPLSGIDGKVLSNEEKAIPGFIEGHEWSLRRPFYDDIRFIFEKLGSEFSSPQFCVKDISRVFADVSETVYADTGHLLPTGNAIVARKILIELVGCGQLKGSVRGQ